ncbi:hypothetical protein Agub_g2212, partial [Astrephomene gubernaculifera]
MLLTRALLSGCRRFRNVLRRGHGEYELRSYQWYQYHTSGLRPPIPVPPTPESVLTAPLASALAIREALQQCRQTSTATSSSSQRVAPGCGLRAAESSGGHEEAGRRLGPQISATTASSDSSSSRMVTPGPRLGSAGNGSGLEMEAQAGGRGMGPDHSKGNLTVNCPDITDLPTLVTVIEDKLPAWAAAGDMASLRDAFLSLAKLGSHGNADTRLLPRALTTLAAAYLPLVPGLRDAFSCVGPLYACAKLGFWEGQLAAALLERLGRDGGELMQRADGEGHGKLWWSVSTAPQELIALAGGALHTSATCLEQMRPSELSSKVCSNILLACARLQRRHDPLLHHLTACLVQLPDADRQALANSLYALGELAEGCGHKPREQDLERLGGRVLERMQQQQGSGRQDGSHGDLESFKPQELSNMLLGCAKLGFSNPDLLHSLTAALVCRNQRLKEQDLANTIHALGKLAKDCGHKPREQDLQRLGSKVHRRLKRLDDGRQDGSHGNS